MVTKIHTIYLYDSKLALRTHQVITNAQCLLKELHMSTTHVRNNTRHKDLLVEFLEIYGEGIWKNNEISLY